MKLGEPDESGRLSVKPIPDSEYILPAHTVIIAVGQKPNPLLIKTLLELKLNKGHLIEVDQNMMTSIKGVFAGGDIVTGAATVILAMDMAKRAAQCMDKYIKES